MTQHHAFVVEAPETENGIETVRAWALRELHMSFENNPDVWVMRYDFFSVADARHVVEMVQGKPFAGEHKLIIVSTSRMYHEAQNALLKLFEEPPEGIFLFLVLSTLGHLLPTLRSRVHLLTIETSHPLVREQPFVDYAKEFVHSDRIKRSAFIKKFTLGKDEDDRRSDRYSAIAFINAIEELIYKKVHSEKLWFSSNSGMLLQLLSEISSLRTYLYDRSASMRMILDHLSLVIPKNLV